MNKYFSDLVEKVASEFKLKPQPWLLFLEGDLGVGKTTFTQELVSKLGGQSENVKSPTFLKLLTHQIPDFGLLLHIDAYRIEESEDFFKLGLEAYEGVGCLIVEWPKVFEDFLLAYPEYRKLLGVEEALKIEIKINSDHKTRSWNLKWQKF